MDIKLYIIIIIWIIVLLNFDKFYFKAFVKNKKLRHNSSMPINDFINTKNDDLKKLNKYNNINNFFEHHKIDPNIKQ